MTRERTKIEYLGKANITDSGSTVECFSIESFLDGKKLLVFFFGTGALSGVAVLPSWLLLCLFGWLDATDASSLDPLPIYSQNPLALPP